MDTAKVIAKDSTQAVGRRKESVARVRLTPGTGQITVNGKPVIEYFRGEIFQKLYNKPFELTNTVGKYNTSSKIEGGGMNGQLDALIHGIARALSKSNLEFRKTLKQNGFITRDPRAKERRKFGLAHKARAKKQSPKR